MNFEPEKFFIGLVDFFSILMPGALLTYLGKPWALARLGVQFPSNGAEGVTAFLFASYLLGHFAFLIGSKLDDWVYDPLRRQTYWGQIKRLAGGRNLSGRRLRALAESRWLFGKNADPAVMQAQRIKERALQQLSAGGAINAYQWCKARLSKFHPEGLVAVQRFEADSKFFRSFVVVLVVLAAFYTVRAGADAGRRSLRLYEAALCVAGVGLGLWRYVDQRFKATQQAYWFAMTLESVRDAASPPASPAATPGGLTHAGGVVYRNCGKGAEYLLVQASGDRTQWVLPKGHIEAGEDPRETAVREVKEESGYWARVVKWVDDARFGIGAASPTVRIYLMEAAGDDACAETAARWPEENRQRGWWMLDEARQKAWFLETRTLLENADQLRAQVEAAKRSQTDPLRAP